MRCINPFQTKDGVSAPCGKCAPCLKRRVNGWAFRLMEQCNVSTNPLFITLTYDTDHVPFTEDGLMTLRMTDIQKFLKRLRKRNANKLKYFYCGEYGDKTYRPHYHMLLFNAELDSIYHSWMENGHPIGDINYGRVEEGSILYTLKYMMKGASEKKLDDGRADQFQCMSKGIGKSYMTPQMKKWHLQQLENRVYLNLKGNKKIAMPRYYRLKIYDESQRAEIQRYAETLAVPDLTPKKKRKEYIDATNAIMKKDNKRIKI